jgi:creatinine amidohydrolase/Fe(II)-dependent formamide hydrolase-like protein
VYELETLTAPELQAMIASGVTTAIVPFGSIEHQGARLPLGADALLADAVGRAVAERLGALLVPTTKIGDASQHAANSGTLTLRPATLADFAYDTAESLAKTGVRVIAFVSTHGGNATALDTAAARFNETVTTATACAPRGDVGPDPGSHAGEWLESALHAVRPDLVDATKLPSGSVQRGAQNLERFAASIVAQIRAHADRFEREGGG